MKTKLDNALCKKYPKIFAERNLPMSQTCMCWGFPGDGWYHIIDNLCGAIQARIDYNAKQIAEANIWNAIIDENRLSDLPEWASANPKRRLVPDVIEQVVAEQVKEKFGGLRFYFRGGDEVIHNYVDFAEHLSYSTCEQCGKPGEVYSDGWIQTLCKVHAKKAGRSHLDKNEPQK